MMKITSLTNASVAKQPPTEVKNMEYMFLDIHILSWKSLHAISLFVNIKWPITGEFIVHP